MEFDPDKQNRNQKSEIYPNVDERKIEVGMEIRVEIVSN